jgi:hypothetical protein
VAEASVATTAPGPPAEGVWAAAMHERAQGSAKNAMTTKCVAAPSTVQAWKISW